MNTFVLRCLLLCKDKNFKANHNPDLQEQWRVHDVCYSAKIRILKQITTYFLHYGLQYLMFVTLQR